MKDQTVPVLKDPIEIGAANKMNVRPGSEEAAWGKILVVALAAVRVPVDLRDQKAPLSKDAPEMGAANRIHLFNFRRCVSQ